MSSRVVRVKTILWSLVGLFAVVTIARFGRGLGATTGLTEVAPWGLWIAFDIMSGVALAAGGFVVAAAAYIFGRRELAPFTRPAILTALIGYAAVAAGLMYDLGLPWHLWNFVVTPQHHSVLFEVGMCVMFYLTVLALEFAPVILEHPRYNRPFLQSIHKFLKRIAIPLVILGIVLSTLHQSSLGSLFLITPHRLHPLWYSPIIWVLFFLSAIALGCMMVVAESLFTGWLFDHKAEPEPLAKLARGGAIAMLVYAAVRLIDLGARGQLSHAMDGSWQAALFWFEVGLAAIVPATLLLFRKIRTSRVGLTICAGMTLFGIVGYRFDVCLVAFSRPDAMPYFPSWTEIAVTVGLVATAMLVFIAVMERFRVVPGVSEHAQANDGAMPPERDFDPATVTSLYPSRAGAMRRYSLAAIAAAAVGIAFLPDQVWSGDTFAATAVQPVRTVDGAMIPHGDRPGHELVVAANGDAVLAPAIAARIMVIDGNRDDTFVLFPHQHHVNELGDDACATCHHYDQPLDRGSSCASCHRDMYLATDIFDHGSHVTKLGGNDGCVRCHDDADDAPTRESAEPCETCHETDIHPGDFIKPPEGGSRGHAVGYYDAMHDLCIKCHEQRAERSPETVGAAFGDCATCHRDSAAFRTRDMPPYVTTNGQ